MLGSAHVVALLVVGDGACVGHHTGLGRGRVRGGLAGIQPRSIEESEHGLLGGTLVGQVGVELQLHLLTGAAATARTAGPDIGSWSRLGHRRGS